MSADKTAELKRIGWQFLVRSIVGLIMITAGWYVWNTVSPASVAITWDQAAVMAVCVIALVKWSINESYLQAVTAGRRQAGKDLLTIIDEVHERAEPDEPHHKPHKPNKKAPNESGA